MLVALVFGPLGAVAAAYLWNHRFPPPAAAAPAPVTVPAPPQALGRVEPPSSAPAVPLPGAGVPKNTTLRREGTMTVVEVGVSVSALDQELAKQRAEAVAAGETVLVMTNRTENCKPCDDISASLRDPRMQSALAKVRLVRVDVHVFQEDLEQLRIPSRRIPSFFLLSVDLTPRDGIDADEWDANVAANMAPVLGAFVRGKYVVRRQQWRPLPATGVSL